MLIAELCALCTALTVTHASTFQIQCERQDVQLHNNIYESTCGSRIHLPCEHTATFPSPVGCDEYLQCKKDKIELCQCLHGTHFVTSLGRCMVGDLHKDRCACPPTIAPPTTVGQTTSDPSPTNSTTISDDAELSEKDAKSARTLAIVWGSIGGVVLVVIIVFLAVICLRRRRSRNTALKAGAVENPEYTRKNSVIFSEINDNQTSNHTDNSSKVKLRPVPQGRPLPEVPTAENGAENPACQRNGTTSSEYMNEYQKLMGPHTVHTEPPRPPDQQNGGEDTNENNEECVPLSPVKPSVSKENEVAEELTYRSS